MAEKMSKEVIDALTEFKRETQTFLTNCGGGILFDFTFFMEFFLSQAPKKYFQLLMQTFGFNRLAQVFMIEVFHLMRLNVSSFDAEKLYSDTAAFFNLLLEHVTAHKD